MNEKGSINLLICPRTFGFLFLLIPFVGEGVLVFSFIAERQGGN
jgi:hypothetical protein